MISRNEYDLCLAWNWEYDADFVELLEAACRARDLSLLTVTTATLDSMLQAVDDRQIAFRVLYDRASDADERFVQLVHRARDCGAHRINSYELARCAWDKAAMHQALSPVVPTPYTIILPSYAEQPDLPPLDLAALGDSFDVKPAHGGGGRGVVLRATSIEQVRLARQEYAADTYLLQTHVVPIQVDDRLAWFRIISCMDRVFLCWWSPDSHVYTPVSAEDRERYALSPLWSLVKTIGETCSLELFSSEVALVASGDFVLVDYVNDPIDLRLQSRAVDGVPDSIVQAVAEEVAGFAARCCRTASQGSPPSG